MPTLIRQARIFDGTEMIGPLDLLVRGALIEQIAPAIDVEIEEVIDGVGKTLLPGLIDCHVHTFGDALGMTLPFGVTTVIDMFTDVGFGGAMRREQSEGKSDNRADLVSAGNLATAPGGHGTQYGFPVATLSSPSEAEDFVQARIDEGSDFIKVIWEPGDGTWPTLDEATIKAVIDAAHKRGKIAVIHISRYEHARRAIEMGVDGLAHIFNDEAPEDDFGRLVAAAGAFAIPTLSMRAGLGGIATDLIDEDHFGSFLMPSQESSLRNISGRNAERTANSERAVRLMVEAGVDVLAGTDAPNPGAAHGASMHRELELLARCGMSPTEVLAAATSKPAKIFGLVDRGVIAEGRVADLLLVDGDPSVDLSNTRRIAAIFKRGQRFDRDGYLAKVVAAKEAAAVPAPKPPKEALENGLISDFEDGLEARFGAGWTPTTDAILGGTSEARLTRVTEGADGTRGALRVTGETRDGYLFPWAGVMFSPGSAPMEAADLSSKRGISFWARGDAGEFNLAVMAKSRGYLPAPKRFQLNEEWRAHEISFADLDLNATDITAIMFVCYEKRPFSIEIDQVRLT